MPTNILFITDCLYDLEQDPEELHNIAHQCTDLVHDLSKRLQGRHMEG